MLQIENPELHVKIQIENSELRVKNRPWHGTPADDSLLAMSLLFRIAVAIAYAAIAWIICYALTIFLPDFHSLPLNQLAGIVSVFTVWIVAIVLVLTFIGAQYAWVPKTFRRSV